MTSSAVSDASDETRQWPTSRSPSNRPTTVWVLPTSTARIIVLPLSHRFAPWTYALVAGPQRHHTVARPWVPRHEDALTPMLSSPRKRRSDKGASMLHTPRLLVVDDEDTILEFVSFNLRKEGYEVTTARDGDEALALAAAQAFDLVILDIMLPGTDGFEVCRRLRAKGDVPVLFLSARDTELDKVVGLEIGGDDYLSKPFGIRELQARVKALLRRARDGC